MNTEIDVKSEKVTNDAYSNKPTVICTKCGNYIHMETESEVLFCSKCGKKIKLKFNGNKSGMGIKISVAAIIVLACVAGIVCAIKSADRKMEDAPVSEVIKEKTLSDVESSVVKVNCYDKAGNLTATGSGFVVYDNRTVITNYHVLENAYRMEIETEDNRVYNIASIVNCSEQKDLAILSTLEQTDLLPLELGSYENVKKGDKVIAVGSPLGLSNTVSDGIISGIRSDAEGELIQITAPISEGSSGGALFDADYNVIGVTFATYDEGENLNFAIPISDVESLHNSVYSGVTGIDALYLQNNPLEQYINVSEYVEFSPWLFCGGVEDGEEYDGMKIKLTFYFSSDVSSVSENRDLKYPWDRESGRAYFYANQEDVTGNYKKDTEDYGEKMVYGGEISFGLNNAIYRDESFEVGEAVDVYGIVKSHEGPAFLEFEPDSMCIVKHKE